MTNLNKKWIKNDLYPIHSAKELKVENTQEFHDVLGELKSTVTNAEKITNQKMKQWHSDLLNLWQDLGQQPPKHTIRTIVDWTNDDFKAFFDQVSLWSEDHNRNYQKELKKRLKYLLLRDQELHRDKALKNIKKQLVDDPYDAVDNQLKIKELVDESRKDTLEIDEEFKNFKGTSRFQAISRLSRQKVQKILTGSVNRRRLREVNIKEEVSNIFKDTQKKVPEKSAKKSDHSGGIEL